jgi:surface antigen
LSRLTPTLLLLTLVVGYYLTPTQAKATTTPLVFYLDSKLNETRYVHRPYPEDYRPKVQSTSQNKVRSAQATRTISSGQCSCVLYVKAKTGFSKPVGNARNFPTNSSTPSAGAIIVTYESAAGHVGIVSHWDDTYVYLESEANYSRCKITRGRAIPINSKIIKGYYIL